MHQIILKIQQRENTNAVLTTSRLKQAVVSFRSLSYMRQNATWVQTQTRQVLEVGLFVICLKCMKDDKLLLSQKKSFYLHC